MGEIPGDGKSESQAKHGAGTRQDQTLRQQLTYQPSPPRSQGAAHGELLAARGGARQQQVRQIHANDEQNYANCAPQHNERPPQPATDVFLQPRKPGGVVAAPLRMLEIEMEARKESIGLALGLRQTHPGLQTS